MLSSMKLWILSLLVSLLVFTLLISLFFFGSKREADFYLEKQQQLERLEKLLQDKDLELKQAQNGWKPDLLQREFIEKKLLTYYQQEKEQSTFKHFTKQSYQQRCEIQKLKPRGRDIVIFDGFTFFDEFELLEIRLNELYDFVDFFILVESNRTFRFFSFFFAKKT